MNQTEKDIANHLHNRVKIYDALIEAAAEECNFEKEARLTKAQDEIRSELRKIIGL